MHQKYITFLHKVVFLLFVGVLLLIPRPIFASTKTDLEEMITERNKQIEELQKLIDEYNNAAVEKRQKAATIQGQIEQLAAKIKKSDLEIKSLSLAIEGIGLQIEKVENQIKETEIKIEKAKSDLTAALKVLGRSERTTPVELLISKSTISSFFNDLYDLYFLQASIKRRAVELQDAKKEIEEMKEQLDSDLQERQELKTLEEMAKQKVLKQRTDQKNVLTKVKKEESEIVGKMKMTEIDLSRIKEQVTYLMKSGVTVEDAIRYGQLAAIRLGIRPAFLIAVLEIESRLGLNVGKGTWKTDMHPRDYDAFAAICSKLNLDPDKTPVSRKPSYGWGGAMGPAQFLPNTWLAYEEEIAKLTSHNPPSPWNIEDAFTAAAIKLARQGASSKSREGEIAATKAYIGGSSSCSRAICISYANAVLDKAEELEEELGS